MKKVTQFATLVAITTVLIGCSKKEAPKDSKGKSAELVLMDTYKLILQKKYDEAKKNFSPKFIEEFVTTKKTTFEAYASKDTKGWKVEWLKTKVMGNDYNDKMWRVKIIPDQGKGAQNGPGIVHDFYIIDGTWKIVFWNNYPKS